MHTISKKSGHLLVTIEGDLTYQALKEAIEEELTRDDYANINDIWQFDNCVILVEHHQFKEIVNDLLQKYPQQVSRTKTALVASSGVSRAFMQIWKEVTRALQYEIQIFMTLGEAEAWIAPTA